MRWTVAALAALALTVALVAGYLQQTVFDADGFAGRVDAALRTEAVSADIANRLADAAVRAEPDLIAVRPLVAGAAQGIVRGAAFRSLVRGAARDVHRSVFDRDAGTVTLTVADTGVLLAEAIEHLRPELADSIPAGLQVRVSTAASDAETAAVRAVAFAEQVRAVAVIGLVAFALLAVSAVVRWRRDGVLRVGVAVAVACGLLALLALLGPRIAGGGPATSALIQTWLDPLAAWSAALAGAGAVAALAAAAILRPVAILPALFGERAVGPGGEPARGAAVPHRPGGEPAPGAAAPHRSGGEPARPTAPHRPGLLARTPVWLRALTAIALGAALLVAPLTVLEIAAMGAGLLLVLAGASELLRLAGEPARPVRMGRSGRIAAVSTLLVVAVAGVAFAAGGGLPDPVRVGRCNGSAALCDKRLDEVRFVGTHNSMSDPSFLFAAQDAGIPAQLADGVRALLIDTHYGFQTPRGVATDLDQPSKSRAKVEDEVGAEFVETAQRLRTRIGYEGGGTREVFLCHAFCEVGAAPALETLEAVHRFLVEHPEEVLILSIEDDTAAADTAKLIRDSGLINEVYRGAATSPWPTLRELIERNERVVVLIENDPGDEPWMHRQSEIAQETPYHFATAAELGAENSCRPNRGGTKGSLLLLNHWVDTSPAPRTSIAREVNARGFLGGRIERCERERGLVANVVAVDFYRQGDVLSSLVR